jgi:hypothetical protein
MKAKERATHAGNCRHVSVSVQRYSVQYKGFNLIGVTTVEGGTRGTTALLYSVIHPQSNQSAGPVRFLIFC